jgi:hypothetical protein
MLQCKTVISCLPLKMEAADPTRILEIFSKIRGGLRLKLRKCIVGKVYKHDKFTLRMRGLCF